MKPISIETVLNYPPYVKKILREKDQQMIKEQVQEELDKLIRLESYWIKQGVKASKPFERVAHQYHTKWLKLYKKYLWLDRTTKK